LWSGLSKKVTARTTTGDAVVEQEAFEKMLGPFAAASRRTPLFYTAIHQVSLLSHAACAIDVHNNDDDSNDNA